MNFEQDIKNLSMDKLEGFICALCAYKQGIEDTKYLLNFNIDITIKFYDEKIKIVKERLEKLKNEI